MTDPLTSVLARYPGAETFKFGDSDALCEQLIALVRSGKKRATCSTQNPVIDNSPPPAVGRCDIAQHWDGRPALVIRTLELRKIRFCDMPEDLALMEGEDDSLASWQANHRAFFERHGIFAPDMMLLWERFELVEDLADV